MLPETCTQGGANGPYFIIFSGPFYVLGFLSWAMAHFRAFVLKACSPLIFILIWQLNYAISFALPVFKGKSACEALTGMQFDAFIGHEVPLAMAWLIMAIGVPLLLFGLSRHRRSA